MRNFLSAIWGIGHGYSNQADDKLITSYKAGPAMMHLKPKTIFKWILWPLENKLKTGKKKPEMGSRKPGKGSRKSGQGKPEGGKGSWKPGKMEPETCDMKAGSRKMETWGGKAAWWKLKAGTGDLLIAPPSPNRSPWLSRDLGVWRLGVSGNYFLYSFLGQQPHDTLHEYVYSFLTACIFSIKVIIHVRITYPLRSPPHHLWGLHPLHSPSAGYLVSI